MALNLELLNPDQHQVVTHEGQHALVLAGAGSGKTRVLTHRIAWMLEHKMAHPSQILAMTFSNKAAKSLQDRLMQLMPDQPALRWIGTFHSLSHRFLRIHHEAAKLHPHFQVIDSEEQLRIIKRLMKNAQMDETMLNPKRLQRHLVHKKEAAFLPRNSGAESVLSGLPQGAKVQQVIGSYQQEVQKNHLLDFQDLLIRMIQTWDTHPELLESMRRRHRYLFVDEFQDTDGLQYAWISRLKGEQSHLMAVGDDDQSIYGWRGARVENLRKLTQDFQPISLFRLEQNYRSTPEILAAANHLIAHNSGRFGKELWSAQVQGCKIKIYEANSDLEEGFYIGQSLTKLKHHGVQFQDCAILYRNNAQSRIIEESLIHWGIPYVIHGGVRFFERQEVKDALAYLRLSMNPHDELALTRASETPPKGIGPKSLERCREVAEQQGLSLWEAAQTPEVLQQRGGNKWGIWIQQVKKWREACQSLSLPERLTYLLHHSGLWAHYEQLSRGPMAQERSRLENLSELIHAAETFLAQHEASPSELDATLDFLSQVALDQQHLMEGEQGETQGKVHLMTLHASKGLEFPRVFMVGMEEGLFPSEASRVDLERLEEERRLAYVGITRAQTALTLTYAAQRVWYRSTLHPKPSRFLDELPKELLEYDLRSGSRGEEVASTYRSSAAPRPNLESRPPYRTGRRVHHAQFGEGKILGCEGDGEHMKLRVQFAPPFGTKTLLKRVANLSLLN